MKRRVTASAAPHESDETENLASSTSSSSSPITTLHPDIIHTHMLTRLDGAALAAVSSVSSELRHLCTDEDLWRNVCTATWPSLIDPIASQVISTFPGGYGSFFSDAFPSLHHLRSHAIQPPDQHAYPPPPPPPEFISAVDIYCQGKPLFSWVQHTDTITHRFFSLTFDLNVLVPTPVTYEEWDKYLEENLSLSWILIDPTRKRAANLSSLKPVSVEWPCPSDDLEVVYAVVIAGGQHGWTEMVQCLVKVTCCLEVGGRELHVTRMRIVMEDMDGWLVTRREGVMILRRAIENGERKKVNEVTAKDKFHNFSCNMKERAQISKAVMFADQGNIRGFRRWFYRNYRKNYPNMG